MTIDFAIVAISRSSMHTLTAQRFFSIRRAFAFAILLWLFPPSHAAGGFPARIQPWLPGLTVPERSASKAAAPSYEATRLPRPNGVRISLTTWTDRALNLIVKYRQNPLRASRTLAYVHAVLHDALLLTQGERLAVQDAAAHRAASCILAFLYPQESLGKLEAEGVAIIHRSESGLSDEERTHVEHIARKVLDAAIARAWQDGAERVWPVGSRPLFQDGQWREAPPLRIITPTEALAGEWKTWALKDGSELQPPPPPVPNSPEELREMEEVLHTFRHLTNEQKDIARRWNLDQGTVTPPGVWNKMVLSFAEEWQLTDHQTVTVLAAMNAGMLDAFIACWRAKFTWWSQRPITSIRARLDPDFMPLLLTPPFPGYVSGHASVSGAASVILAGFFPDRSEQLAGMAEEAALSRLYGGIHIRSDNDAGLALGKAIGDKVLAHLRTTGHSVPVAGMGNR
jgi:hypothetical protein